MDRRQLRSKGLTVSSDPPEAGLLRPDEHVKKWGHDMDYFLVLMRGEMRSYSRSLIEEKSDAVSEAG